MKAPPTLIPKRTGKETLVLFSDFDCPPCRALEPLIMNYTRRFNIPVQRRHLPLERLHPHARRKAELYEIANASGFAHDIAGDTMRVQATVIEMKIRSRLAPDRFVTQERLAKRIVAKDLSDASALGIQGTPTLFYINESGMAIQVFPSELESALERNLPLDP